MINSKKCKFMCLQKNLDMAANLNNCISMKDGSSIEHVKECVYLGNTINSDISIKCIGDSVSDLFISTNSLIFYLSTADSTIVSILHNTHCMSIYGSQLWKFNRFWNVNKFYIAWRKTVRRVRKINSRPHNVLINKINEYAPLDVILRSICIAIRDKLFDRDIKRCFKFLWILFNSRYACIGELLKCLLLK